MLSAALDRAEVYLKTAPANIVGAVNVDGNGTPIEVASLQELDERQLHCTERPKSRRIMPKPANAPGDQFRRWLETYARQRVRMQKYDAVVEELRGKVRVGRKLGRAEINER